MDDATLQILMQLALAARGGVSPSLAAAASRSYGDGNPFAVQNYATTMQEEDHFFGSLGDIAARFIPGMTVPGIDGRDSPVFKTNMRWQNDGQTGFQRMMMEQNRRAYSRAADEGSRHMGAAWESMFGENNALRKTADEFFTNQADRDMANKFLDVLGNPAVGQMAIPMTNALLGYDRGAGAIVANQRSMPMALGYASRYGINGAGPGGMVDPFSEDFQTVRNALASGINGATQSMMYDGAVKKASMHGASEQMVSSIIADMFESGGADEYLKNLKDENGNPLSVKSVTDERTRINKEIDATSANRAQAMQDLSRARKEGDEDYARRLEEDVKKYDENLESLKQSLTGLNQKIGDAMEPLLESVTGVVSSLKDFYGTEEEARRALDNLTGGKGSKDKATADRVRDQMTSLKLSAVQAGLDPTVVGQYMESNRVRFNRGMGSNITAGSGYDGQLAAAFTASMLGRMPALTGDPAAARRYMDAANASVESYAQSEGNQFAILLQAAKEDKAFEGREDELARIEELSRTGSKADFDKAKQMLAKIGFGSEDIYNMLAKNPAMLAQIAADLSQEGKEASTKHGVEMREAEVSRMRGEQGLDAGAKRRKAALSEAGVSSTVIDNRLQEADYNAIDQFLHDNDITNKLSEEDLKSYQAAEVAFTKEYELALEKTKNEKNPDGDPEEARRMASKAFLQKGYVDALPTELRASFNKALGRGRSNELYDMEFFGGADHRTEGGGFLRAIGAADKTGEVTRSGLTEASKNIFSALSQMGDTVTKQNGEKLSKEELETRRKEITRLLDEGRGQEAADYLENIVGDLDESTQTLLRGKASNGAYRHRADVEREGRENDLVNEAMMNKGMAEKMNGMSWDDRVTYAKYHKDLQRTDLDEEERKKLETKMKDLEEKAAKENKSDGERALEAFATGDWQQLVGIFKNGNVTMEQFFATIRGFVRGAGGVVGPTGLDIDVSDRDARAKALNEQHITFSDRLEGLGGETTSDYLELLAGADVKVSTKEAKRYDKDREKALKGDRKSYVSMLEREKKLLEKSEKALQERKEKSDTDKRALTPEERQKLSKELEGLGEDKTKEREKIEKRLKDADEVDKERRSIDAELEGVSSQKVGIDSQIEKYSSMSNEDFKKEIGAIATAKDAGQKTSAATSTTAPASESKSGLKGTKTLDDVCDALDRIDSSIKRKNRDGAS